VATAAIALVAALLGWQVGRTGQKRIPRPVATASPAPPPTAPPPSAAHPPTPTPRSTEFQGEVLRSLDGVELVVGGDDPAIVELPSGASTRLGGLPPDAKIGQLLRVRDATVALVSPGATSAEEGVAIPQVYLIRDGSAVAERLPGAGFALHPGASPDSFWLMHPPRTTGSSPNSVTSGGGSCTRS
jgi:hypothetical protein